MKIFPIMSSPLLYKFPVEFLFQSIALMAFQNSVVLQPAHHDPWPDADGLREIVYGFVGEMPCPHEFRRARAGGSAYRPRLARLLLVPMHFGIDDMIGQILRRIVEHERTLVPVKQDVSDFMKKREPELIVRLVPKRQSDESRLFRQPPGASADAGVVKFRHPDHGHAGARANRLHRIHNLVGPVSGCTVSSRRARNQPLFVEIRDLQSSARPFGLADPGGHGPLPAP